MTGTCEIDTSKDSSSKSRCPGPDDFAVHVVEDINPDEQRDDDQQLQQSLAEYGVVCLHMRTLLDDSQLQRVVKRFGSIKEPFAPTKDGGCIRYAPTRQNIDTGRVISDDEQTALGERSFGGLDVKRPGLFETFHCDDTYTVAPARACVLHARALPPSGGGPTCFIDMRDAYNKLSAEQRERIRKLQVVYAYNNAGAFPPRQAARGPNDVLVDVQHPLVRTHPLTARPALFIDLDRATHVDGMALDEGRRLLQALQDHSEAEAAACEHHWQPNDVLVWDNARVQHKASGTFKVGEPRAFWRYMVAGEPPT